MCAVQLSAAAPGPPPATLLGFDYGMARIGVAVGQTLTASASALDCVDARDGAPDWDAITALLAQWRPGALVVGLPLALDGGEQEISRRARRFARQLQGRYQLPVHLIDERHSTRSAAADLVARGRAPRSRQTRQRGALDAEAARIILEAWLQQGPTSP